MINLIDLIKKFKNLKNKNLKSKNLKSKNLKSVEAESKNGKSENRKSENRKSENRKNENNKNELDKKNKSELTKIIFSFFLLILGLFASKSSIVSFSCYILSYIILGTEVIINAFKNLVKKNILDENLLMFIATIGAFFLGEYAEGVAVMLFYQIGEFFNSYASQKSKRSIKEIVDLRPDYANLMVQGRPIKKPPEEIKIGDIIMIKAGERVPLDCTVQDGNSNIDTSALTGEAMPIYASRGSELLSGYINLTGTLLAKVKTNYSQSAAYRILDLVQNATEKKSHTENLITKFAKYYTPIIIVLALIIAIFPPLMLPGASFSPWIYRALVFLVVSCPCALVLSIPLSFFCGIGAASKKGILIKGSSFIENLALAKTVVFDKTGTLTKGIFSVTKIVSIGISKEQFLEFASYAEIHSSHPIAVSIKKFFDKDLDESRVESTKNIAGHGVETIVSGKTVCLGNEKFMNALGLEAHKVNSPGSVVHMAIDKTYCGYAVVSDKIKEDAFSVIKKLYSMGIEYTAMLTGDSKKASENVAKDLGLDYFATGLLPEGKSEEIKKLENNSKTNGALVFVGDGVNDAPVLASADVGIAMGSKGADAAVETADVVIMDDSLTKVAESVEISKFIMNIAKQNMAFSLGVKFTILLLSVMGFSTMWGAVFADVGVSVLVVLNSLRILKR